jgi:hypothetical protein
VIPISPRNLKPGESGPGESNPVSLRPERSGLPSSSNPVEKAGIEPARQRLQGATAAVAAIPEPATMGTRANVRTPAGPSRGSRGGRGVEPQEPDNRHSFDSPSWHHALARVELAGFEPAASAMRAQRSPG